MLTNEPVASMNKRRLPLNAPPSQVAKGGVAIGLIGLVVAILFWAGIVGSGSTRVDTSSPSFIRGSQYGSANFSPSTSQGVVCTAAHADKTNNLTEWLQGCHEAWAIASYYFGYRNLSGGPVP